MATLKKFVTQTDWIWYEVELSDEQLLQYKKYGDEWEGFDELDWEFIRDKPASDEVEYTLELGSHDPHLRSNGTGGVL